MGRFSILALVCALLLSGCAGQKSDAPQNQTAAIPQFIVPESNVSYTAYYAISDSGSESAKAIWRSGGNARVALILTSDF